MWYKFAKQGSVWSRIGPDAEAQFDTLLDQATVFVDGRKQIDMKTLNEVFQKSNFKDVVVNFVEGQLQSGTKGLYTPAMFPIVRKLSFFKKYIPNVFRDYIALILHNSNSYNEQISTIKHEFAHLISSYTIPNYDSSLYINAGSFTGTEIGNSIQETNKNILVGNIRKNLSSLNKYLSIVFGSDLEDFRENDNVTTEIFERELEEIWPSFIEKIKNKEITVPKEIMKIIKEISNDNFERRINLRNPHIDISLKKSPEQYQRIHNKLQERAKLLDQKIYSRDLYAANPEETLAHVVEMQHLFSIRLLREYFSHLFQTGVYNFVEDPKKQYLEDIKIMFNYLIGITDETSYTTTSSWRGYQNPREYAKYFSLSQVFETYLIKLNDQKFKQQVAKHLSNVYQQLKQEFSVETGSFKDLNENPPEENLSDQNKKEGE